MYLLVHNVISQASPRISVKTGVGVMDTPTVLFSATYDS